MKKYKYLNLFDNLLSGEHCLDLLVEIAFDVFVVRVLQAESCFLVFLSFCCCLGLGFVEFET